MAMNISDDKDDDGDNDNDDDVEYYNCAVNDDFVHKRIIMLKMILTIMMMAMHRVPIMIKITHYLDSRPY